VLDNVEKRFKTGDDDDVAKISSCDILNLVEYIKVKGDEI
jgi:hypothetical protein